MITPTSLRLRNACIFAAAFALFSVFPSAQADTITGTGWKGTSGTNWSTAGNWDATAPSTGGSGDRSLFFGNGYVTAGGTGSTISNNDLTNWNGYRITFEANASAPSFTLTGNGFTLFDFGSGLFPKIENLSSKTQTFSLTSGQTISLQGNQTGGQQFAEIDPTNGNMVFSVGTKINLLAITQLRIYGNNTVTFNDVISSTGNSGANSVSISGQGLTSPTVVFAAANTYTGDTFVNKGTLQLGTTSGTSGSVAGTIRLGDTTGTGDNTTFTLATGTGGQTISSVIEARSGNTGTATISSANTSGTDTFTGNITLSKGLTITGAAGGTTVVSGTLMGGATALTKTGAGKLTLTKANTYTGATTISAGSLNLNFNTAGAPGSNIISSSSALSIGGGTLSITGSSSGASTQTFASTSFTAGNSVISAAPASGGSNPTVTLGALTFALGATVQFVGPATINGAGNVAATATITTTTAGGGGAAIPFGLIYGGNPVNGTTPGVAAYATVGSYDWASTDTTAGGAGSSPYTIIGGSQVTGFYSTTVPNGSTSTGNWDMTANTTLTTGEKRANTLRFNTTGAPTLSLNSGNILTIGGILITPNIGAVNTAVNGSAATWQIFRQTSPNGAQEGVIWQNNTAGYFTLGTVINDGRDGTPDLNYIVKAGDGTAIFNQANTYTGQTYVNGGNLVITTDANVGAVATAAAVNLNNGTLFGNATFTLDNAGANFRPVSLLGNGGGLAASAGNTMTVDGVVSGGSTSPLTIGIPASSANSNTAGLLPGTGSGTANTTAVNAIGAVALTGANTFSGGTVVQSGTVNINGINALGGANYGGITFNGGGLQYSGPGTNGSNDVTTGKGITLSSGTGAIDTNGNNVTFAAAGGINGAGTLGKTGAGSLILTASNGYSGGTVINSGTLKANNSTGSATGSGAVTINNGGTLGGTGLISGLVTTGSGGHLAPGNSVGTITLGSLTLSGSSILDYEFNGTPANDLTIVTGSNGLTINGGGFNLYSENLLTAFSTSGTYNLIAYTGSISGTGISAFSVLNQQAGKSYTFGSVTISGTNFVNLTIASAGNVATWNINSGGSWATAAPNWDTGIVPNSQNDVANFGSIITAPRTVTLDGDKTVNTITFTNTNSYTISTGTGGTIHLSSTGSGLISDASGSHTIAVPVSLDSNTTATVTGSADTLSMTGLVSGTGVLTKSGAGTLALTASNSYSAGTTMNSGTLQIGDSNALGSGAVAFTGNSALKSGTAALNVANPMNIASGITGTVDTQGNTFTLSGPITDATSGGILAKTGTGTLILTASNSYSGGTVFTNGVVRFSAANNLGTGGRTFNGGTLQWATGNTADITGTTVTFNSGGATFDTNGNNVTLANGIGNGGTGGLTKTGSGTLTLAAASNYSGNTIFAGGTLSVGNGGTTATLGSGTMVFQGGTLTNSYNTGNSVTFGQNISVASGQTGTINMGNRSVFSGTVTGSGTLNVNAATSVTRNDLTGSWNTFAGQLNFAGGGGIRLLTQGGSFNGFNAASVDLEGTAFFIPHNFSGGFTANFGALTGTSTTAGLGASDLGGQNVWSIGGLNTSGTFAGQITAGSIVKNGSGALTLTGTNSTYGSTTISAGTLQIGNGGTTGSLGTGSVTDNSALVFNRSDSITVSNAITGSGSLAQSGSGSLTITGTDSVGSVLVHSGSIVVDTGGSLTSTGYISIGNLAGETGVLTVQGSGALTVTSGAGDLNVSDIGGSTGTLNATGSATVAATSLWVGKNFFNDPTGGTGTVNQTGGTFTVNGANGVTLASGSNSTGTYNLNGGTLITQKVSKDSIGTSGVFNFNGGTLKSGTNNATFMTGLTSANVLAGGAIIDTNGFNVTIGQALLSGTAGDGGLTKNGNGTLTLSASNSYVGSTTVSNGTLQVSANNSLGSTAAGTTVSNGASLKLSNVNYSNAEALTLNGTGVSNVGALTNTGTSTYAGAITVTTNSIISAGGSGQVLNLTGGISKDGTTLTIGGGGTVNVNTVGISGTSANSDVVVDASTLVLSASSSYNGPTYIRNGGTINASVIGALPISTRTDVTLDDTGSGSSTLALGADQVAASLTGAASSTVNLGSNQLTVGATSGTTTFAGTISGSGGSLVKDGASTQVLSGSNSFTGATTVNNGTLTASASGGGALANTASITVNNGGTLLLGGNNQINNSAGLTMSGASTFSTGGYSETLGTLTLSGSSTIAVIDFAGGNAVINFSDSSGATWTSGATLAIYNWDGNTSGGGNDRLFFAGSGLSSAQQGQVSFYSGGSGSAFLGNGGFVGNELVPIPEPATIIGAFTFVGLIALRERRRITALWKRVRVES